MEREFKNLRAVAAFLKEEGWKAAQSTVYEHSKMGMIRPDVDKKRFSLKAVLKYAQTHLVPVGTMQKKKDEDLQRTKTEAEIDRIREQARREKIKRLKEEGEVIDRDRSDLENAGKLGAFEAALKGRVQMRAGDYVALVGGDERKTPDLVRTMMEDIDQTGTELAGMRTFEARFE